MQGLETQAVIVDCRDGVGWITLNRPDAINAINDEIRESLPLALEVLDKNPAASVIVLTGSGQRGFCAGADIKEFKKTESQVETRNRMVRSAWIEAIDRVAKPIIAAIHGVCYGGGFEIALACDIRIASADARFSLPETGLGLIPGAGGTQRLPRLIGLGRALDMMLLGERIDAQEALRLGVITRLVPDHGALLEQAHEIGKRIAARPPLASAYAKEAARKGFEMELQAGLDLEKELFVLLLSTQDRLEAAAAFKEKRAPVFRGK